MNWRNPLLISLLHVSHSQIIENFAFIKSIYNLPYTQARKYQEHYLKKILFHAYHNIPYYHDIFNEINLIENNQIILNRFQNLPFLTKDIIRTQGSNIHSKNINYRNVEKNTSGGSTGKPVEFIQDTHYKYWNISTKLFFFNTLFKKNIGEPNIALWGSERDIFKNSLSIKEKSINLLYNRKFLNAFKVDNHQLYKFVHIINTHKPKLIWTYVESIDLLATFIKHNNLNIHKPDLIISTAGTLYPDIRENIEETFRCPVYDQYGSREVGPIAIQTPEQSELSTFFWLNYIEIIDSKIYVTSLQNYAMPLIRYEIGDTAEAIPEDKKTTFCGVADIKRVLGRVSNHFKNEQGQIIHGEYFTHLFYHKDWIQQFQVIQKNLTTVICKVVLADKQNNQDMQEIENNIQWVMGDNCQVKWDFVTYIEPSKSGKYLYIISEVTE